MTSSRVAAESIGALAWCALATATMAGAVGLGPIEVLFLLAPLVLVQLALRVLDRQACPFSALGRFARWFLPLAGVAAAAAFLLPEGPVAALLGAGWLLACVLAALDAIWRLFRGEHRSVEGVCRSAAFVFLAVGAVWLVLSRAGITPFQLPKQTVLLAALHFHFTGFVLPIMVGATSNALRTRALAERGSFSIAAMRCVTAGVFLGPPLLAAGNILVVPALKVVGALLLSVVSILLAVQIIGLLRSISPLAARILLAIAAISITASMVLVGVYAVGEFMERPWPAIAQMAWLHGSANAIGFGFCGLLGWGLASDAKRF